MSKIYSPKIVTDSLVMCLDASNNKSYPTDLPVKNGLVMWMDAADDTTFSYSSGTTVSQWRDKSGSNYHMTPVSAGPTRNAFLNSRKVLAFTTAQQIWNSSINLVSSPYTVFCVTRLSGTTPSRVLSTLYTGNTGGNWLLGHWGGYVNQYFAEGWIAYAAYAADNTWRMYMGDWGGPSNDIADAFSNGTSIRNQPSADASAGPLGLGINISSETSTCEAAEIVVFNRLLSTTERKQVNTYLGQKWGISNTDRSIIDLSNNNNHGLLGNGTTADMPLFDVYNKGALKLDGSTEYVAVANATSLNPTTVTVSIWVKRNGYQSQTANYLRRNYNDSYAILSSPTDDSSLRFRIHNGTTYPESPTTTLALNEWTNIVGTYDLANIKIYKNGVFVGQTAHTSAISYSSANTTLTIGRDDPVAGRYMNANYGSVLIYSRALSAAEVAQNYEAQKSKFANTIVQQGLVLNLDAGNPYSYAGAGTTIYDVSATALSWTGSNVTYNSDPIKYFSYNGSNSWLQSSTSTAYDSQTITMECWCYPNTLSQEGFLFEKGSVNTQYSMFFESITNPNFVFRTMGTVSNQSLTFNPNTYLTVSAWNHIVCTYNGSSKIMYVNGVQVASVAASGTLPTGQVNQYIGRHTGGYFFNGRIAESRVYNISLSAAQVLQNYNATKGRFGL